MDRTPLPLIYQRAAEFYKNTNYEYGTKGHTRPTLTLYDKMAALAFLIVRT